MDSPDNVMGRELVNTIMDILFDKVVVYLERYSKRSLTALELARLVDKKGFDAKKCTYYLDLMVFRGYMYKGGITKKKKLYFITHGKRHKEIEH